MQPLQVSVIVPVYNQELYVTRCIRSLLHQSIVPQEYEIIVINDASDDNTQNVLLPYIENINYIENKTNLGLAASLNLGIKNSKSQFIVRVDADDWVHKDYLHILKLHLDLNYDMDAIACDYKMVDSTQRVIQTCNCLEQPIGCGVMFRYQNLIEIGLYDKNFKAREEEDLRIRFLKKFKIDRVQLPLYYYRQHENNKSKDTREQNHFLKRLTKKHKNNDK